MERVSKKIYYEGRVQGVGFRYTVRRLASGFEITGSIRNLADGRVELIVTGEKNELQEFLIAIRESELAGHIQNEIAEYLNPPQTFKGFQIL
ncbi:MAG: acylphosphatase [Chthoniobacterales bacterium]